MSAMRGMIRGVPRDGSAEAECDSRVRRNELRKVADRDERADASAAVILVDADLQAICLNAEAIQVLGFSAGRSAARNGWKMVRTQVLSGHLRASSPVSAGSRNFVSGRRRYRCRVFPLEVPHSRRGAPAAVVVIERDLPAWFPTAEALAPFHLTAREEEAVRFALASLTNKQIAEEMGISPNTVKALLRLAMTKIGVSSRLAILCKLSPARDAAEEADIELAEPILGTTPARHAARRDTRRNPSRATACSDATGAEFWLADCRRLESPARDRRT